MKAFERDRGGTESHASFTRSFSSPRARHIKASVDAEQAAGRFWPDALLSLNPAFEHGSTADRLAGDGIVVPETAHVFRRNGAPFTFRRQQDQAIVTARAKRG